MVYTILWLLAGIFCLVYVSLWAAYFLPRYEQFKKKYPDANKTPNGRPLSSKEAWKKNTIARLCVQVVLIIAVLITGFFYGPGAGKVSGTEVLKVSVPAVIITEGAVFLGLLIRRRIYGNKGRK